MQALLELSCLANMYYYYIITCILFYSDFMYLLLIFLSSAPSQMPTCDQHTHDPLSNNLRIGRVRQVALISETVAAATQSNPPRLLIEPPQRQVTCVRYLGCIM